MTCRETPTRSHRAVDTGTVTSVPPPMHFSTGDMDAHTQVLFYVLCFGPFLALVIVLYREHRRTSRKDPLEEVLGDTDRYLAPELRRRRPSAGANPGAESQREHKGQDPDRPSGVPPPE